MNTIIFLKRSFQSYPPADDRFYESDQQGSTQQSMNDANNFKPESYNPSKYDSYAHQSSNSDYAGNSYSRNNDYDQRKFYYKQHVDSAISTIKYIFSSRIELGCEIIWTREFKTDYFETRISFFKRPKDRNSNYTWLTMLGMSRSKITKYSGTYY